MSNELILLGSIEEYKGKSIREILLDDKGFGPLMSAVEKLVKSEVINIDTKAGRDSAKDLVKKIAKTRTYVKKLGDVEAFIMKEEPKKADKERKRVMDFFLALEEETGAPLAEWEKVEQERVSTIHRIINDMIALSNTEGLSASEICARGVEVALFSIDDIPKEFQPNATLNKSETLAKLVKAGEVQEKHEADQARLAELEAAETKRKADEAKEQEAKEEADRKAKAKADEDERVKLASAQTIKDKEEVEAKLKTMKYNATVQAVKDEETRIMRIRLGIDNMEDHLMLLSMPSASVVYNRDFLAERDFSDFDEFAEEAEIKRIEVLAKYNIVITKKENEEKDTAEKLRQEIADEEAKEERERVAARLAIKDAETRRREENKSHRNKINKTALEAIMDLKIMDEAAAKEMINAIYEKKIPNVTINY